MRKKSPLVAFLLSLIPGLGQLYAGATARGVTLLIGLPVQALLLWLVGLPSLVAWLVLVWIWNLFDAARLARGQEASTALPIAVLVILNIYVGWRITGIAPRMLAQGLPRIGTILVGSETGDGLFQPDLLEPRVEEQAATAKIVIEARDPSPSLSPERRGEPAGPVAEAPKQGGPHLLVEPSVIRPPATVRAEGSGFAPEASGRLILAPSGRQILARFVTNAEGRFAVTAEVPVRPPGQYWIDAVVERPLGGWRASETLEISSVKMAETIFLALMGTMFSVLVAIPLSFFGAKNLMGGSAAGMAAYGATRMVMNVLRSIEVLIIALMMVRAVGIGPFAGVLALAIHGIGALGKLYSEAIESIDPGPIEAITATGANRFQVVMFGVVPQVVPQFVAFTFYRWDINVRMATVIGLVGGGGIGFILKDYIDLLRWPQAGTALLLIAVTVISMDYASALIRERLQ